MSYKTMCHLSIILGLIIVGLIIALASMINNIRFDQATIEKMSAAPSSTPSLKNQNHNGVSVKGESTTVPFNPETDLAKRESSPRPSRVTIEPKLYLSCYNPNTGESGIKCGPPITAVPIGKAMILEINIDNIDPSKSHTIRTTSWSTYEGNFNPQPNEWDIWGTLEFQEKIPAGETFHQTNIFGQIIGIAGWWTGKKKVEIYWDDELVKTFYFDSVPRNN